MAARIVVILLFATAQMITSMPFCVDNRGQDEDRCLETNNTCCKSLSYLLAQLEGRQHGKIGVHIEVKTDILVNGLLSIKDYRNLSIESNNMTVTLACQESSGIYVENVTGFVMQRLTIQNCGMLQNSSTSILNSQIAEMWCAMFVTNSSNLLFERVTIRDSKGTGMLMDNTHGEVHISSCSFDNNTVCNCSEDCSGGGGLIVEINSLQYNLSSIIIRDTNFTKNHAFEVNASIDDDNYMYEVLQNFGRGGGLFYSVRDASCSGNSISITNCKFVHNEASTWGGGLYVLLHSSSNNSITVQDSNFIDNTCTSYGGGGVNIVLVSERLNKTQITFRNCNFTGNRAHRHGGGVLLESTRENEASEVTHQLSNRIDFENCTWYKNQAKIGSAMDIYPAMWDVLGNGVLPRPSFTDCIFQENYVKEDKQKIAQGISQTNTGAGTLFVSNFAIDFCGFVHFLNNVGSGLYMQSGLVVIKKGANVNFTGNKANMGGGVSMHAFSVIYISDHSRLRFVNNTASVKGGAIYALPQDLHETFSSRSCFLQADKDGKQMDHVSARFLFDGNVAQTGHGNSIYAASLKPCCKGESGEYFGCMANVTGLHNSNITTHFSWSTYKENLTNLSRIIPGQFFRLPVEVQDEFNKTVNVSFDTALDGATNLTFQHGLSHLSYISGTRTIRMESNGTAEKSTLLLNHNEVTISISVTVLECPPGYVRLRNATTCTCDTTKFDGIWKCDRSKSTAFIISGYWIGLCGNVQCTGRCPVGFCTSDVSTELSFRIRETSNLCDGNRKGKVCGQCIANHSVFFHSPNYKCGSHKLCRYGILFYVASELIPLTVMFIIILMCNISFTTGLINGVVLYAQIFDSFIVQSYYDIASFPQVFKVLRAIYRTIYTATNLNYFTLEQLSFCLWPGATTLDIIAMKYVTIVYALLLILLTVFLLNTVTCKKLCVCWRPHNLKNAVIHGFSAFLVMCYSQCAKVSFLLLATNRLKGYDFSPKETVILFSGENMFFDKVHVKYAIPALFFMLIMGILPPLALILYPLSFKILGLCHLSELKIVNWITNRIPVQFFDSFQSCFKDNFRFFSGLYFFYRVIPLILSAVTGSLIDFYFSVEVFLILALALNATLQPYKKHWHNVADSLIFANLAIINAISLYNYQKINDGKDNLEKVRKYISVATAFQLVLIYLPLVYVLLCLCWLAVRWVRKKVKEWKLSRLDYSQETLLDSIYLPPLRESITASENPFHKYNN